MKLTEKQIKNREDKVKNTSLSLAERKKAHEEILKDVMNPSENFDPKTWDPMSDVDNYEIKRRTRKAPPSRLPTMGMLPKEIMEGQMVGMYESKQDLYLILAHYINGLLDEIESLKKKVDNLNGQKN